MRRLLRQTSSCIVKYYYSRSSTRRSILVRKLSPSGVIYKGEAVGFLDGSGKRLLFFLSRL
jgi:hypothetical protein